MPELAEVEFYRCQWNPGIGRRVVRVNLHRGKRVFRGTDCDLITEFLPGTKLLSSAAHGKQMLFRFSTGGWLGLHLGMTGSLRTEGAAFVPETHDHCVVYQGRHSLVFNDPRQFGRVRFACGDKAPEWWNDLPVVLDSAAFTVETLRDFLQIHGRLPIKAALLLQDGFPGIGNWMADEILWRARLQPARKARSLAHSEMARLWRSVRFVCRGAMRHISPSFEDPPRGWFYHHRWQEGGICPSHRTALRRATIGGRTTAWCPRCQR